MKKKNKQKKSIIILILIILLICGVGYYFLFYSKGKKITIGKTTTTTTTKVLKIVNPETKTRPFAVMINNLGTARPLQSGLQDAIIMYEIIVEGGLTRYMAVFQDQTTERIGSIRSARHYFLDYALENDAIYVHHGYSPQALSDFSKLDVDHISVNETSTGWRDKSLTKQGYAYEHTLFTSIEKLNNGTSSMRKERNKSLLLSYSIDPIDLSKKENAKVANNISITYSTSVTSSYVYDATNNYYLRSVNGKEHKDYVTGNQYHFKNIITYQVQNYTLSDSENKGRKGLDNIGSGTGYFITNGYSVPITWEKKSRSTQTIYKYENGDKLIVNDGNTFIQIQPKNETLTIE
jgi:hypothetical protein